MCTVCIDNLYTWAHTHTHTHTRARTYNHAWSCTETDNGINHLLQPINRTFRYPEPMRRDAFPPISSKSHLIRAICACRAARDCADRKLHRGVPRVRSRRKGCGSESYPPHGLFPPILISSNRHFRTRRRRAASCRRASRCHTFSTGQDKFLPLCFARTRLAIVLYRETPHGRTGEFHSPACYAFPFGRVISR